MVREDKNQGKGIVCYFYIMMRAIIFISMFLIQSKLFGQGENRLIRYHTGFNINYVGEHNLDFTFPIGAGISFTATLNKFSKFKPTIEISANGFSEFVLHLFNNNSSNDSKYTYGTYNFLTGTKYKLTKSAKFSLVTGASINSAENSVQLGLKPSFELNTKKEKLIFQVYYLKIFKSTILNGFVGISMLVKIR